MEKFPRGIAIAGVGDVDYETLYRTTKSLSAPRDPYALAAEAFKNALDDCGLKKEDIDGVICVRDVTKYDYFCYRVGISKPMLVNGLNSQGRQSGLAVQYAAMAIASGQVNTVAVVYSNVGKSNKYNYGSDGNSSDPYGLIHGMTSPGAQHATMFNRYRFQYGATEEHLYKIAEAQRYHASLNSHAVFKTPLTREEYMAARYITEPLRLYDYCMISDGAVCMILTTVERARDLKKPVVRMLGTSTCGDMANSYMKQDFFYKAITNMTEQLYGEAGVTAKDCDVIEIYDNFTPTVMYTIEGIGLADIGGAGDYIDHEGLKLGQAKKPINTHGGHTSEAYMQGWNHHVECVRQVRGECGERQVPDCRLAMYTCTAPIVTGHIFAKM